MHGFMRSGRETSYDLYAGGVFFVAGFSGHIQPPSFINMDICGYMRPRYGRMRARYGRFRHTTGAHTVHIQHIFNPHTEQIEP